MDIQEHQSVVLLRDDPASGLVRGDIGAVVHSYATSRKWEVEFVSGDGHTVALLTLGADEIRPIADRDILHVRELASS